MFYTDAVMHMKCWHWTFREAASLKTFSHYVCLQPFLLVYEPNIFAKQGYVKYFLSACFRMILRMAKQTRFKKELLIFYRGEILLWFGRISGWFGTSNIPTVQHAERTASAFQMVTVEFLFFSFEGRGQLLHNSWCGTLYGMLLLSK